MRIPDWLDAGLEGKGLVLQRAAMDARSLAAALRADRVGNAWALAERCDALAWDDAATLEALEGADRRLRQGFAHVGPLVTCVRRDRDRLTETAASLFRTLAHRPPPTAFPQLLMGLAEELREEVPFEPAWRQRRLERWAFALGFSVFTVIGAAAAWWVGSEGGVVPTRFAPMAVYDSHAAVSAISIALIVLAAWHLRALAWTWLELDRRVRVLPVAGAAVALVALVAFWAGKPAVATAAAVIGCGLKIKYERPGDRSPGRR